MKYEKFPGLAFSRNFGHKISTRIGIIAEPEIFVKDLEMEDQLIIMGTDGLWEFINNEEMALMLQGVVGLDEFESSGEMICLEAFKRWRMHEAHSDDITAIVLDISAR